MTLYGVMLCYRSSDAGKDSCKLSLYTVVLCIRGKVDEHKGIVAINP